MQEKTLWSGGRLSADLDIDLSALNQSLSIDQRMAQQDIQGSRAWCRAIAQAGILTEEEFRQIDAGLAKSGADLADGTFQFRPDDEDIHSAVERQLSEEIGPVAGKLHTGRSRNDQVATDFRLWLKDQIPDLISEILRLESVLVDRAESDQGIILPGYTHFQQAQPILLSHWWLAHFWAFERDRRRFIETLERLDVCPLGSGALAGTTVPVDRFALAADLGFRQPAENSLDAVSDRDFAVDFLYSCAMIATHLSRLAEALILYTTVEYGYLTLSDRFSTGSSLMPQKKNPDSLELVRAQAGIQQGRLTALMAVLKGLPSAYDKDLQEDKRLTFEAFDTAVLTLKVMRGAIATLTINADRARAALRPDAYATDAADYLVRKGVPFREAHHIIGKLVKRAELAGTTLERLPLEDWRTESERFDADVFSIFTPEAAVAARSAFGGTAPARVREGLLLARAALSETS